MKICALRRFDNVDNVFQQVQFIKKYKVANQTKLPRQYIYTCIISAGGQRCTTFKIYQRSSRVKFPRHIIVSSSKIVPKIEVLSIGDKYRKQIKEIKKEIKVDDWIKSINASDEQVKDWLKAILKDYNLEPSDENISMLKLLIEEWIRKEFEKEKLELSEEGLQKIFNFIIKIAYDSLC